MKLGCRQQNSTYVCAYIAVIKHSLSPIFEGGTEGIKVVDTKRNTHFLAFASGDLLQVTEDWTGAG